MQRVLVNPEVDDQGLGRVWEQVPLDIREVRLQPARRPRCWAMGGSRPAYGGARLVADCAEERRLLASRPDLLVDVRFRSGIRDGARRAPHAAVSRATRGDVEAARRLLVVVSVHRCVPPAELAAARAADRMGLRGLGHSPGSERGVAPRGGRDSWGGPPRGPPLADAVPGGAVVPAVRTSIRARRGAGP
jgi:hypothetical protein